MNHFKRLFFLSFTILVACAPPQASIQQNDTQIIQGSELPVTPDQTITTKGKATTKAEIATGSSTAVPSSWDLSGAMAARSKNKSWSASVNWLQRGPGSYQIRLFGPVGSGTVMIERQGGAVTFRDGPKRASSSNADELLSQQTGIRLPVNNLYYWVRGIPAPGAVQSAQRDQSGHLVLLRQAGFTIQYLGYTKSGNMVLPSQIKLQGNGVFIKFVIKRWKI